VPQPNRSSINQGRVGVDIGFPGNPLIQEGHKQRFWDCMDCAPRTLPRDRAEELVSLIEGLDEVEDVRSLVNLLLIWRYESTKEGTHITI
jgi:hypothetical protein